MSLMDDIVVELNKHINSAEGKSFSSNATISDAIIKLFEGVVPKEKVCSRCDGTGMTEDIYGDEFECSLCPIIYQWNECRDQILKNIKGE